MAEMMAQQKQVSFGSVLEISKADWVDQVNKAGESGWVIVHVYTEGWVCSSSALITLFIKTTPVWPLFTAPLTQGVHEIWLSLDFFIYAKDPRICPSHWQVVFYAVTMLCFVPEFS